MREVKPLNCAAMCALGQCRIGFHEHVNVIRHYLKGVYRSAEFGGFLFQQFFQPLGHRAAENRLAVFRTPNQVVFERENCASIPFYIECQASEAL
jgi:hypothetical protein